MFSMDELAGKLNISKQSLYKLIKNNSELSTIVNEHSTKEKRKIFYDETVLNWLMRYYHSHPGVANGVEQGDFPEESKFAPVNTPPSPPGGRVKRQNRRTNCAYKGVRS